MTRGAGLRNASLKDAHKSYPGLLPQYGFTDVHTDKHRCVDSEHLYENIRKPRRHPDSCGLTWRLRDRATLGAKAFKYPPRRQVHLKL